MLPFCYKYMIEHVFGVMKIGTKHYFDDSNS